MGRLIFKQPNGLYGKWSGIVDAFVWYNFSKEHVKNIKFAEDRYIVTEKDFRDYNKYDLDYIIENEGFSICYRAYQEGDIEEDVFQAIKDMGASKSQIAKMKKIAEEAKKEYNEFMSEEEEDEEFEPIKAINEAAKNIKREDLERQYGIYENPCYVYCPREQYNIIKEQGILDTNDKYFDDVHNEWVKVIPYDIEENK